MLRYLENRFSNWLAWGKKHHTFGVRSVVSKATVFHYLLFNHVTCLNYTCYLSDFALYFISIICNIIIDTLHFYLKAYYKYLVFR